MNTDDWFDTLNRPAPGPRGPDPRPLTPTECADALDLFAIPAADRAPLLATLPGPESGPRVWEALVHCHRTLFADAAPIGPDRWPDAPDELGPAGRYFYAHLCLLALPRALELRRERAVPYPVTRATFADLGAKLAGYRRAHGTGGFDRQAWISRHLRGRLHRLGRLQFELRTYDSAFWGASAPPAGGAAEGEPVLDVHIPGDGPLSPSACDAAFAAARPFADRHHPEHRATFATCHSWLLDPTLADHLKPDANILAFQRRFTAHGDRPECDSEVLEFVFARPPGTTNTSGLPRRTTLQKALLNHLDQGGHWHMGRGWTPLS
ncbi:acyltransferase domain-containing protein [Streptomyces sp. NPDC003832]